MARVVRFTRLPERDRERATTEVSCGYRRSTVQGIPVLHLETYGSQQRQITGKVSQSIEVDEEAARQLIDVIKGVFSRDSARFRFFCMESLSNPRRLRLASLYVDHIKKGLVTCPPPPPPPPENRSIDNWSPSGRKQEDRMRGSRFTDERIICGCCDRQTRERQRAICAVAMGSHPATFYNWKARLGGKETRVNAGLAPEPGWHLHEHQFINDRRDQGIFSLRQPILSLTSSPYKRE